MAFPVGSNPYIGLEDRGDLCRCNHTISERGFKLGDRVFVGGSYSVPVGTVVGLNPEFPFKAQVLLEKVNGVSTTVWIPSNYLAKA